LSAAESPVTGGSSASGGSAGTSAFNSFSSALPGISSVLGALA
jgi:hypothetical protein